MTYRHNWGEDRVYFHDEHGLLVCLPACWTSVVPPDPFVVFSAGRSSFRAHDLLELAALMRGASVVVAGGSGPKGGVKPITPNV